MKLILSLTLLCATCVYSFHPFLLEALQEAEGKNTEQLKDGLVAYVDDIAKIIEDVVVDLGLQDLNVIENFCKDIKQDVLNGLSAVESDIVSMDEATKLLIMQSNFFTAKVSKSLALQEKGTPASLDGDENLLSRVYSEKFTAVDNLLDQAIKGLKQRNYDYWVKFHIDLKAWFQKRFASLDQVLQQFDVNHKKRIYALLITFMDSVIKCEKIFAELVKANRKEEL